MENFTGICKVFSEASRISQSRSILQNLAEFQKLSFEFKTAKGPFTDYVDSNGRREVHEMSTLLNEFEKFH